MTDPMDEIKAQVDREYAVFDEKRVKLIATYHQARTSKTQLKALAKIVRQHGEYVNRGLLSGWTTQAIIHFADQMDVIADDMD